MSEELKEADSWRQLVTECPHCGEVQDIDESALGEDMDCFKCEKPFIPVE